MLNANLALMLSCGMGLPDEADYCVKRSRKSMDQFAKIMRNWEHVLNADEELRERNKNQYSSLEGRTAIELIVGSQPVYRVEVKDGKFKVTTGTAEKPLLRWKVPEKVFKEVLLKEHQLMFNILDPRGELSFDTPNFTHWNGATIIEMLLLAVEMITNSPAMAEIAQELE
jgi:hypothetical protein